MTRREILATMKKCYDEQNYLACPHTAVGLKYSYDRPGIKRAIIATASPDKFPEAISASGVSDYVAPSHISALHQMSTKYDEMKVGQDWYAMLANKIKDITAARA